MVKRTMTTAMDRTATHVEESIDYTVRGAPLGKECTPAKKSNTSIATLVVEEPESMENYVNEHDDDNCEKNKVYEPLDLYGFKPSTTLNLSISEQRRLHSLDLDYFTAYIAPASGPKSFVTMGFEERFTAHHNDSVTSPKWFIGASTGALRFISLITTIVTHNDAITGLVEQYCDMVYKRGDTPATLKPMMDKLYTIVAPEECLDAILNHDQYRLLIPVTRLRQPCLKLCSSDFALKGCFATALLANMVTPASIPYIFEQLYFYTGPEEPQWLDKTHKSFHRLTKQNFYQVLHATTAVPFVQERCCYIDGVGEGLFLDGGVCDFTLNFVITDPNFQALLLSDELNGAVQLSGLDYYVPWRKPNPRVFEHVSIIYPRREFLDGLPKSHLPSVRDWFKDEYIESPEKRRHHWRTTRQRSVSNWPERLLLNV